jgi:putative acetyltransferase
VLNTVLIRRADPVEPRLRALLERHVARARAETAPGSAHALDIEQLRSPAIAFFAAWDGEEPLGVIALKRLADAHGEVKSMYTAEQARRRGIGAALLARVIAEARGQQLTRLSLETGSWDYFEPARSFYRRCGFRECGPFADYRADPNSVFMTLELGELSPP